MKLSEFVDVLERTYADKPDIYIVSIGHAERPFQDQPISMGNLPEIVADTSITVGDIRSWREEVAV